MIIIYNYNIWEHKMTEEKFDYKEFAKSMYEQSPTYMPEDI